MELEMWIAGIWITTESLDIESLDLIHREETIRKRMNDLEFEHKDKIILTHKMHVFYLILQSKMNDETHDDEGAPDAPKGGEDSRIPADKSRFATKTARPEAFEIWQQTYGDRWDDF